MTATVLDRRATSVDEPVVDRRVVRRRLGPGRKIPFSLVLGPVLLVGLWFLASATGWLDPRTLSQPWVVAGTAGDLIESGRLQDALRTSAVRAFSGLGIGIAAGTLLALVAGLSRLGESVIDGPIQIKRSIPTLALIPLLILWLGINEEMKIVTIALAVMLPVYIHTHNGLRSIDGRYAELAETVDVSRLEFIRSVVLPGAMPGFLLGLRFAVTTALLSLVVVEQFNAIAGIGYLISLAQNYGQTDVIVVCLVVYALLGLAADGTVRLIERRALAWRRTLGS
ncbi:MAG: sulfonate transport system permease protein [Nocardioidaceae bacterium]|nr:sulfonate transport system permease protein [Nocardioidaceae bacterium]